MYLFPKQITHNKLTLGQRLSVRDSVLVERQTRTTYQLIKHIIIEYLTQTKQQ